MSVMKPAHLPALDLNLLVALDALLSESSVTAAAKRTGVTQSAMSHSLARLRDQLGDPLLVRSPRGMLPTPRARALSQPLRRALTELRSVVTSGAAFNPATARRSFTIATSDYASFVLMPKLMARLGREAPHIEIVVRPVPTSFAEALEDESVDLVISPYPEPRATLIGQKLFGDRFVCVARKDHPALDRTRGKLDLETFCALSHVLIAPRGMRGGPVDDALAAHGRARHVALRITDFLVAPPVVAETDLVLTLPERIARVFVASHGLRIAESPITVPGFSIWQIWHARRKQEPAHAWLRGVLSAVVKERESAAPAARKAASRTTMRR